MKHIKLFENFDEKQIDELVSDYLYHSYDSLGTPGQRGKDHPSLKQFLDGYSNEDIIKDLREHHLEGDEKHLNDDQLNSAINKCRETIK